MTTLFSILRTAYFLLRAAFNDLKTLLISLFTPLFMLVTFWLVGRPTEPGDPDLAAFMFPAIIGLTVMLGGQTLAMRLVNWRAQGVFQRLSVTPTPLGQVVLSMSVAQAALSVLQAGGVFLFGVFVLGFKVDARGAALAVGVLVLGVSVFVALGLFIASLSAKPDIVSAAFIFTLLPMFFLGGGFPPSILPEFLQQISPFLPTAMVNSLLNPLFAQGAFPSDAWQSVSGLLLYTFLFSVLGAWRFRWD